MSVYYGDPSSYGNLNMNSVNTNTANVNSLNVDNVTVSNNIFSQNISGTLTTSGTVSANSVYVTAVGGGGGGSITGGAGSVTISTYPGGTYSGSIPVTVSNASTWVVEEKDEIKSKNVPVGAHDHDIQCRLRVEATKVISEYYCHHCNDILFSKVISKIPKSIINKKCLPRLVKGV